MTEDVFLGKFLGQNLFLGKEDILTEEFEIVLGDGLEVIIDTLSVLQQRLPIISFLFAANQELIASPGRPGDGFDVHVRRTDLCDGIAVSHQTIQNLVTETGIGMREEETDAVFCGFENALKGRYIGGIPLRYDKMDLRQSLRRAVE